MSSGSQLWNHFYNDDDHDDDCQYGTDIVGNDQDLVSGEMFFDLPPDSFWVPQADEKDWVDHHAVMQRKSSMKLLGFIGNSNRNHHSSSNSNSNSNSKSYSHRFSPSLNHKSKAISLLGLPRTQKSGLVDGNLRHNKAGNPRLFRSLSEPGGRVILDVPEPGSPKVSCMGRVQKQKGRAKRTGLWSSFKSVLRIGFGANMLANKGNALSA